MLQELDTASYGDQFIVHNENVCLSYQSTKNSLIRANFLIRKCENSQTVSESFSNVFITVHGNMVNFSAKVMKIGLNSFFKPIICRFEDFRIVDE